MAAKKYPMSKYLSSSALQKRSDKTEELGVRKVLWSNVPERTCGAWTGRPKWVFSLHCGVPLKPAKATSRNCSETPMTCVFGSETIASASLLRAGTNYKSTPSVTAKALTAKESPNYGNSLFPMFGSFCECAGRAILAIHCDGKGRRWRANINSSNLIEDPDERIVFKQWLNCALQFVATEDRLVPTDPLFK
jgi:hypothetical protein